MVRQSNEYCGCRAEMRDPLTLDEVPHHRRIDLAQYDVRGSGRGRAPRGAPAIAVEHGQCPEVDAVETHAHLESGAEPIQIGATVSIDDSFGLPGGAAGVVDADGPVLPQA